MRSLVGVHPGGGAPRSRAGRRAIRARRRGVLRRCDPPTSVRTHPRGALMGTFRRGRPHPQGWFTGVPQVSSPASLESTVPCPGLRVATVPRDQEHDQERHEDRDGGKEDGHQSPPYFDDRGPGVRAHPGSTPIAVGREPLFTEAPARSASSASRTTAACSPARYPHSERHHWKRREMVVAPWPTFPPPLASKRPSAPPSHGSSAEPAPPATESGSAAWKRHQKPCRLERGHFPANCSLPLVCPNDAMTQSVYSCHS